MELFLIGKAFRTCKAPLSVNRRNSGSFYVLILNRIVIVEDLPASFILHCVPRLCLWVYVFWLLHGPVIRCLHPLWIVPRPRYRALMYIPVLKIIILRLYGGGVWILVARAFPWDEALTTGKCGISPKNVMHAPCPIPMKGISLHVTGTPPGLEQQDLISSHVVQLGYVSLIIYQHRRFDPIKPTLHHASNDTLARTCRPNGSKPKRV